MADLRSISFLFLWVGLLSLDASGQVTSSYFQHNSTSNPRSDHSLNLVGYSSVDNNPGNNNPGNNKQGNRPGKLVGLNSSIVSPTTMNDPMGVISHSTPRQSFTGYENEEVAEKNLVQNSQSAAPIQTHADRFQNGIFSSLYIPHEHKNTGFIDLNTYWDTRDFSVFTINAGAKLPYDFEYFQFINLTSPLGDPSELENWNDFFTEIHFRRPIAKNSEWLKHLDWNLMWADGGFPGEVGRFGIRWRWQDTPGAFGRFVTDVLQLRFSTTFHILEDDGSGWQIEHVFRRNFFDGLVYVGGFADHNINGSDGNSDWVAECQVGLKLYGNCFAVVEQRYNSFLPTEYRSGLGVGVEYVIPFR